MISKISNMSKQSSSLVNKGSYKVPPPSNVDSNFTAEYITQMTNLELNDADK